MQSTTRTFRAAIMLAVLACSAMFGTAAFAGPLACNFNTSDDKVFSIQDALTVQQKPGVVEVKRPDGSVTQYQDTAGAAYTAILASACYAERYVSIPLGTSKHANISAAAIVSCASGQTRIIWTLAAVGTVLPTEIIVDGCQTHALAKAGAN